MIRIIHLIPMSAMIRAIHLIQMIHAIHMIHGILVIHMIQRKCKHHGGQHIQSHEASVVAIESIVESIAIVEQIEIAPSHPPLAPDAAVPVVSQPAPPEWNGISLEPDSCWPAGWSVDYPSTESGSVVISNEANEKIGYMSAWGPNFKYQQAKCRYHGNCSKAITRGDATVGEVMQWLLAAPIMSPIDPTELAQDRASHLRLLSRDHKDMFIGIVARVREGHRFG